MTEFARSLPSLYQLLPEYACIEPGGNLQRTTDVRSLPNLDTGMLHNAMRFHTDLKGAEAGRPRSIEAAHMIVGTRQPTTTTVRLTPDGVEPLDTISGASHGGDGTVPLPGALGHDLAHDTNRVLRVPDQHTSLHHNRWALDGIEEVLRGQPIRYMDAGLVALQVTAPELLLAGEDLEVTAQTGDGSQHGLVIRVTDEDGQIVAARQPHVSGGRVETRFRDLTPGAYTIDVSGLRPSSPVSPVSTATLVWPPDA